jgi:hypothetical protein
MARYFLLTTTAEKHTFHIAPDWLPAIEDNHLIVTDANGGTHKFPLTDVHESRFMVKRSTPVRDARVAELSGAYAAVAAARAALHIPDGLLDEELQTYVDTAVALDNARNNLTKHDAALVCAKNHARLARKGRTPVPHAQPTKARKQ